MKFPKHWVIVGKVLLFCAGNHQIKSLKFIFTCYLFSRGRSEMLPKIFKCIINSLMHIKTEKSSVF